jgi:hypothetical protein
LREPKDKSKPENSTVYNCFRKCLNVNGFLDRNVADKAIFAGGRDVYKPMTIGCFRTLAGAEHFCVIRSCLDTLRKQGHSMLPVLQRAFAGNPIPLAA